MHYLNLSSVSTGWHSYLSGPLKPCGRCRR
ncbi:hypothetical protein JK215_16870 [Tatumella sp. JGM100]|nr:hypothetical protein [Tatumella sp. JGM94]MBS0903506.1 hypothetical protein [Tatumella sp. JGM100]